MTYAEYVATLQNLLIYETGNAEFVQILPSAIEYAENRIYREVDFLAMRTTNATVSTVSGTRTISIPAAFLVVESICAYSPAGSTTGTGTLLPLTAVSKEFLQNFWPDATSSGVPAYYAPVSQDSYLIGPTPNGAYLLEIVGPQQPTHLSAVNTTTVISTQVPDLLIAASMVYMTGYQRAFDQQSSDPAQGQAWETQYQELLAGVLSVEGRRKIQAASWTPLKNATNASDQRG